MELKFLNNVISINHIKKQDKNTIKTLAKIGKSLYPSIHYYKSNSDKVIRSLEIVNSAKYKHFNNAQKLIIISNMIFVDDNEFSQKILEVGFDIKTIIQLDNIITNIKILRSKKTNIEIENELLDQITHTSQVYFGIKNPSIIINKINQLIVTNPELFQTKTKENQKILAKN